MLIIDSRNAAAQVQGAQFDWPGPFCLYAPLGAPSSLDHLDTPEDWFLFQFTSQMPSTLSAFRDIIVATDRTKAKPKSPVLFISDSADAAETIARAKEVIADPKAVDYTLEDDGDLKTLVCGETIGANPMFVTFFRFMAKGMGAEHTKPSLDMMPLHLGN